MYWIAPPSVCMYTLNSSLFLMMSQALSAQTHKIIHCFETRAHTRIPLLVPNRDNQLNALVIASSVHANMLVTTFQMTVLLLFTLIVMVVLFCHIGTHIPWSTERKIDGE